MAVIINKRLLNADEASAYFSIGKTMLYSWIKRGLIPTIKLDGCTRFDVLELDEVVDKLKAERQVNG